MVLKITYKFVWLNIIIISSQCLLIVYCSKIWRNLREQILSRTLFESSYFLHVQHCTGLHVKVSEPRRIYCRLYWMRFHLLWDDNIRKLIRFMLIWWNDRHKDISRLVIKGQWRLEPLEVLFLCGVHNANKHYRYKSCGWGEVCSDRARPNEESIRKRKCNLSSCSGYVVLGCDIVCSLVSEYRNFGGIWWFYLRNWSLQVEESAGLYEHWLRDHVGCNI